MADAYNDPSSVEPPQPPPVTKQAAEDNPMLFCPACSTRLDTLKCKLFCSKCGYYMSCADYY